MEENLSKKKHWYHVSEQGIQFYSPKTFFIGWENIGRVLIVNDVALKRPKLTFGFGLLLITSVLILIPIQKLSFPVFGKEKNAIEAIAILLIYLATMGFGIWSIRKALVKKPVLKIYFKSGGQEIIVLEQGLGTETTYDIISSFTKHLGVERVIFCEEAA